MDKVGQVLTMTFSLKYLIFTFFSGMAVGMLLERLGHLVKQRHDKGDEK